jgi:hypothetical protein
MAASWHARRDPIERFLAGPGRVDVLDSRHRIAGATEPQLACPSIGRRAPNRKLLADPRAPNRKLTVV